MNHAGITHVGVNGGFLPRTSAIMCRARLIMPVPKYSVVGAMAFLREFYLPFSGIIYSPGLRTGFLSNGEISLPYMGRIEVKGTALWVCSKWFSLVGYKSLIPMSGRWLVKGIKRKAKTYVYPVEAVAYKVSSSATAVKGFAVSMAKKQFKLTGLMKHKLIAYINVRGDKAGETHLFYLARGAKSFIGKAGYSIKAINALGSKLYASMTGRIRQTADYFMGVQGQLSSNVVNFLYGLKGYIPKIAFIASVPKRFQDFVSNKRWFR